MNKEEILRNLKYEKEKHKNDRVDTFSTDISALCTDVINLIERCIEIPENPTNGDVIKAVFPNKTDFNGGDGAYFNKSWWNEPYAESEEV